MYRRLSASLLVIVLLASVALIAGCGKPKIPGVKDGTFVGTSPLDSHGNYGIATITIENGRYKDVKYVEINGATHQPKAAGSYQYENALQAIEQLPKTLLEKGDIDKVDVIAKATGTSNTFKAAVKSALANASATAKTGMADGTYELTGPTTHNNYPKIKVTISGGQITAVEYNEYMADTNKAKAESNYPHKPAIDAIAQLPAKFMETKDLSKVDTVAGATHTSNNFKDMVQTIMWLAAAKDGVYEVKGQPDEHGNQAVGKLVINNHKIIDAAYDEIVVAKNLSKTDPNSGYTYPDAINVLKVLGGNMVKYQYTEGALAAVDATAKATGTKTSFKATMEQLLQAAGK